MEAQHLKSLIDQSIDYAEKRNFAGYDPYDALNTSLKFLKKGRWMPVLLIQAMKRLPINLRPVLGIPRGENPKALGLFLEACSKLELQHQGQYRPQCLHLLDRLDALKTPGFSGTCWGYHFDWASPVKVLPKGSPTIVVTGFIAKGLYEAIKIGGMPKAEKVFREIEPFISNELPQFEDETGLCISYSTVVKDCCYNASALAAGYYARLFDLTSEDRYREKARKIIDFVVARQHANGRWDYSVDLNTGKVREQTDFHQGFIVDSIVETMMYLGERPDSWARAVSTGAEFYLNQQFAVNGRSFFRIPRQYPTDVHHQAQGIITCCRISTMGMDHLVEAEKMTEWAMMHLHDQNGSFYYRYFRFFTDKTRYMRWGQAWMTLALTKLYLEKKRRDTA